MSTTQTEQPRKFMFDRSFDNAGGPVHRVDRRPVTLTPEQLDAVKKEAHDTGFAAGKKTASEDQARHLNATVDKIGAVVGQLIAAAETNRPQQEARVREAVLAIAKKVLPDFAQRHGLQEIEAVVAGVIGEMTGEPRLVVRVNEGQFDTVNEALKAVTEKQGYTGKIVLVADAEVKQNDCRVEWADGGVDRNLEALWQNLTKTLAPERQEAPPPPQASDAAG
jgi:flagellar assembly protein FliH